MSNNKYQAALKGLAKAERTKKRQEEALAETIGQIDMFQDIIDETTEPQSKPKKA